MKKTLFERFTEKYVVNLGSGCWEWIASLHSAGYGQIGIAELGRPIPAHRVSYELFKGAIPEGLDIDHLCRNRRCVNPEHLEAVSRSENLRRSQIAPSTINAMKTCCANGHPFDETNTGSRKEGWRVCRRCNADREQKRRDRLKRERAAP